MEQLNFNDHFNPWIRAHWNDRVVEESLGLLSILN